MLKKLRIPAAWCPPEAAVVAGAILGIAILHCPWTALFCIVIPLLPRRSAVLLTVFMLAAAGSGLLRSRPPVCRFPHRVRAEFLVSDLGLSRHPDMPVPAMTEAEPLRIDGPVPIAVRGRIGIRFPRGFTGHPAAGDVFAGEGILVCPDSSYGQFLAGRGIDAVLTLDSCRQTGHRVSWRSKLAECREILLNNAVRHLEPASVRRAAASLFFGIKGGLDRVTRRELVNAGVIHLYSVSGLHVGILTGVLLLLFRPLPFRLRYFLLIPLTLLYVLSTGANVPAVRAWIMIAVWAGCRTMLRWMPVRKVLAFSAAGMLVFQPSWITDMGFLYSFGITAVLILLNDALHDIRAQGLDPAGMMPRSALRRRMLKKLHFRNRILGAVLSCTAAFAGGAAVSLLFQERLLPGSVLANLLLMPAVGLLFPLMAVKIAAGWLLPGLDRMLAEGITCLWQLMDGIAGLVSGNFSATVTGPPAWWSVALLLAGGLLLIGPPLIRKSRRTGLLVIGCIFVYWHGTMFARDPAVMVLYGGYAEVPAIAFADTAAGIGCAVNVPDAASAAKMAEFFLAHGIAEVDRAGFSASRSAHLKGLQTLVMRIPVRQIVVPESVPHDHVFRTRLRTVLAGAPGTGECSCWNNLALHSGDSGWGAAYRNPASGWHASVDFPENAEQVTINGKTFPLPHSSELRTLTVSGAWQ